MEPLSESFRKMAAAIVYGITGQRIRESEETAPAAPGEETPVGDPKELYRVQTGAYGVKENAEAMKARLQEAGFDAVIVKA